MLVTVHNPPTVTNTTVSNFSRAQPTPTDTALGFRQLPLSAREKGSGVLNGLTILSYFWNPRFWRYLKRKREH